MIPAVAAAHVTPKWDSLRDKFERLVVVPKNPWDILCGNLAFELTNRQLELPLFDRHCNEFIRKRSTLAVGRQCMQEREAVLSAGNANRDFVAGAQHGK